MIVKNRFIALILGSLFLVLLLNPAQTASAANPPALGDVLINEYVANSSVEWVELYNTTANDRDISGHYIDDIPNGGGAPKQIPANTIIPAYGYYVMTFSNFLNNGGDDVRFLDPSQNVLDSVSYTSSTPEHSYYRFPDGGIWSNLETANTTPGASNPGTGDQPWTPGTFDIRVFDVGQGDSQLIIFPSGYSILIDVRESSWNSSKGAALIAQKIRTITGGSHVNVGMLSHLHLDHIGYAGYGGFWALIEIEGITFDKVIDRDAGTWVDGHGGGTVDGLCDPDLEIVWYNAGTVSGTARNWLCYATNPANTNIYSVREVADLWSTTQIAPPDPGAVVTIIQVDGDGVYMADGVTSIQGDHTGSSLPPSENDYSIAVKVRYGQIDYATAGDADGVYNASQWGYTYNDVETIMADRFGQVDIMRVNHHGSGNSTNQYYVDTLAPDVSLISCGPNSFGHPKQEVVDRLTAVNDVYITSYCAADVDYSGAVIVGGDIVIRSTDGVNYTVNGAAYVASDPQPPPPPAQPVAFAAWDFEDQTRNPSLDLAGAAQAAVGSGLSGESFTAGNPGGTSGKAWSFTHWSLSGAPDSAKYVEFQLDLTAYENLSLSFAERRSSSGPSAFAIHYSLDGLNFTEIPATVTSLPNNTNWRAHAFDLSGLNAQIAGQTTVQFRLYGYNASGATGTWRLDDVTFIGEPSVAPPPPPPPPPDPVEFSGWNFEDQTRNASVDLTGAAVAAPGSGLNGESFVAGNPGGASGKAWNFTHWSLTGNPDATKYVEFKVNMSAYQNLSLSFAERRSNTGPLTFEIHYSVDGLNFTQIAGSATSLPSNTNWRAHSFDLSGLNNQISGQPAVYFRIYGYNASGATGTWRLDDVSFVGQ